MSIESNILKEAVKDMITDIVNIIKKNPIDSAKRMIRSKYNIDLSVNRIHQISQVTFNSSGLHRGSVYVAEDILNDKEFHEFFVRIRNYEQNQISKFIYEHYKKERSK